MDGNPEMKEIQIFFQKLKDRGLIDKLRNRLKQECFQSLEHENSEKRQLELVQEIKAVNRFFDYLEQTVAGDIDS